MKLKTKEMTIVAVMAALICVLGPLSVFIGPIPLSLATFAIYLAGAVLGAKLGPLAAALYLMIGSLGIPVFSGFSGGLQKLTGVTGGYLFAYPVCAWIVGLAVKPGQVRPARAWLLPLNLVLGTLVLYAIGTMWFIHLSGNTLAQSMALCVTPFLPGDAVKIIAASLIVWPIRRAIYR